MKVGNLCNFDAYFLKEMAQLKHRRLIPRWLLPLLLVLIAVVLVAWSLYKDRHQPAMQENPDDPGLKFKQDSCIALMRTGDLLLRTGRDMTSRIFREMNQVDKTYSHAGLVVVENGYPFVYHSIGGEDNPDERLRRDSASFFISSVFNTGFGIARYQLSDSAINQLVSSVYQKFEMRPLFDMDFDLSTDDKLYCSEFVYKVMLEVTGDTGYIPRTSLLGHNFVGIDNLFMNPNAILVCELKYK